MPVVRIPVKNVLIFPERPQDLRLLQANEAKAWPDDLYHFARRTDSLDGDIVVEIAEENPYLVEGQLGRESGMLIELREDDSIDVTATSQLI